MVAGGLGPGCDDFVTRHETKRDLERGLPLSRNVISVSHKLPRVHRKPQRRVSTDLHTRKPSMKKISAFAATGLTAFAFANMPAFAQDVTGAGASFPAPLYAKWAAD